MGLDVHREFAASATTPTHFLEDFAWGTKTLSGKIPLAQNGVRNNSPDPELASARQRKHQYESNRQITSTSNLIRRFREMKGTS